MTAFDLAVWCLFVYLVMGAVWIAEGFFPDE